MDAEIQKADREKTLSNALGLLVGELTDTYYRAGFADTQCRRQPLTEPAVIPLTNPFCAIKMNSAVGMVESVMAAAMLPHSTA